MFNRLNGGEKVTDNYKNSRRINLELHLRFNITNRGCNLENLNWCGTEKKADWKEEFTTISSGKEIRLKYLIKFGNSKRNLKS